MANSYPQTVGYTGQSIPTLDPTQNASLLQKLLAQMGQAGTAPPMPQTGAANVPSTSIAGSGTQQAGNAGVFDPSTGPNPGPGAGGSIGHTSGAGSGPGANTTELDPNNPIDAVFLKTGYGDRGIGSGFGDLSYWRQHADQASRLLADQQGTGSDTPGPGDTGNTSHGMGGGGTSTAGPLNLTGGDLLQQTLAGQGNDPSNTIFARIMAALQGYSGGQ